MSKGRISNDHPIHNPTPNHLCQLLCWRSVRAGYAGGGDMIDLFGVKDAYIKQLEEKNIQLEKSIERALKRKQRLVFQILEFKKFSPRLWFDYFSDESGQFSGSARSRARFEKWLNEQAQKNESQAV